MDMLQQLRPIEIKLSLSTCPLARGYGSARLQNETPLSGGTDAPSLDVSKEFIARAPLCHFAPTQLLSPFTQDTRKAWAGSFEEEPTKRKTRGHATTLPTTLPLTDHSPCHSNTSQPPNFSSPLETKSAWAETFEEERTKRKRSGHATTLPTTPIYKPPLT